MDQPIDYSLNVQSPFQAAMQGYQGGAAIRDDQQHQQAIQQQQQAAQQQSQVLSSLIRNPNATANDYANATLLVPGMKDQLKQAWDTKNTAQQQSAVSDLSQYSAAITNGQPQVAVDMMNSRADAMEAANGGQPTPQSQALRTQAQVVTAHPDFGRFMINATLAAHPDGSKVVDAIAAQGKESRAVAQAPADLVKANADAVDASNKAIVSTGTVPALIAKPTIDNQNVTSQISDRASRLGLDRDKLTTETQLKLKELGLQYGQLPAAVGEAVTTAATDAIAADQSATKMLDLASRIDKNPELQSWDGSGGAAKGAELWKKAFGGQNELTRLRSEYNRIVTPAAMSAYKKVASGSTSDKDIDVAMTGVPSDTADPATMSAFLRGAAKLQVYESVLQNARSEWLGANRNLGKATQDIEIDGVRVPSGTTFSNFAGQYVDAKVKDRIGAQTVAGRGYMQFATPAGQ